LEYMTRYLIEGHLKIPVGQVPSLVSAKTLWDRRLRPPAQLHGLNFIGVIQNAYPNTFSPWDFKQVSHGYWQGEEGRRRAIEAVRYIIKEKCNISHHEIPLKINHRFFKDHRLVGVFALFGDSPYQVINAVYPRQFKPWEFANVPINYWKNPRNVKQTMEWFLFRRVGFSSYEEGVQQLKQRHFFQHRLTGFLQMAFDNRLFKVKQWMVEQLVVASKQ
jgi:hypothetical protein